MTDPIATQRKVARNGIGLKTLVELLEAYGVEAMAYRANSFSLDEFRERAVDFLGRTGHHVIVNYSRLALGQEGRGHISPLAAYHAMSERFLVLDVARYISPPVWVEAESLFAAMAEPIGDDKRQTRGFVLICLL